MARIRVRARAVDMLGRQQIAGIPTAIHELFKNAHDAYAEHVEVDFFRSRRLLVMRDDGIGMTLEDFEGRWLTLGTESKVGANRADTSVWTGPKALTRRPILGEKGIGRLAIAAIGPQVLVMTRAVRPQRLHDLVVGLVNWGLFEIPGIDLDRIEVPIDTVPGGEVPSADLVKSLVERVRANVDSLRDDMEDERYKQLSADLERFSVDPARIDAILGTPSLRGDGYGTQFVILPTSEVLDSDIDDDGAGERATPLKKNLLGFTNTMMPDGKQPPIVAEFRDRRIDGTVHELIGPSVFLTPEDFQKADHHFDGEFDEAGQFRGTISIYGKEPKEVVISWPEGAGAVTRCGPFRLRFAYLQGNAAESRVPPEEHAVLSAKLDLTGGLYIYRDGIRILPYGNSDFDFLNIERRRTKSAQDWFFSYRRLFGAVEISHIRNPDLVEKAGREGFRENFAYKQFRAILENFFVRIAILYFRETSPFGDEFTAERAARKQEFELLKRRDKQKRTRQRAFSETLEQFFRSLEKGIAVQRVGYLRSEVEAALDHLRDEEDADAAADAVLSLERRIQRELDKLQREVTITRPRGVGLNKRLQRDWDSYERNFRHFVSEVLSPARAELSESIGAFVKERQIAIDSRRRVVSLLDETAKRATGDVNGERRRAKTQMKTLEQAVNKVLSDSVKEVTAEIERTMAEASSTEFARLDDTEIAQRQVDWEKQIAITGQQTRERLGALAEQFDSLVRALAEGDTLDATTAALESRSEELREDLDLYTDLAQIGMALGIVQHEFQSTVHAIRRSIQALKPWAEGTPALKGLYDTIRSNFEHFDGYLTLFTPLNRRLYRKPVTLSGEEIRRYLDTVFGARMERHGVRMVATSAFDRHAVVGFPSTFLPVFVNLVDNAIYWLTRTDASERQIRLDADERGFLVLNTGPGVPLNLTESIFEYGVTTKLDGRGIGLFVSRQALRKEGFDIRLEQAGEANPPVFLISTQIADTGENNSEPESLE